MVLFSTRTVSIAPNIYLLYRVLAGSCIITNSAFGECRRYLPRKCRLQCTLFSRPFMILHNLSRRSFIGEAADPSNLMVVACITFTLRFISCKTLLALVSLKLWYAQWHIIIQRLFNADLHAGIKNKELDFVISLFIAFDVRVTCGKGDHCCISLVVSR